MPDYRMMVVVPTKNRKGMTILEGHPGFPVVGSGGPDDYFCGKCGVKLVEHVAPGQVRRVFIKCPDCGSYNSVDSLSPTGE
jgi:hypothetical protein